MEALTVKKTAVFNRGYLICLAATVLWSFTGILIGYLSQTYRLPALVLAFWRDLFVALGLIAIFSLVAPGRLRLEWRHLGFFVLYGLVVALFNSIWTVSVALNGAAVGTVLAYSSPAFTALLGGWVLKERVSTLRVGVIVLSMIGCLFVSKAYNPVVWDVNALGVVTGLASGLMFAFYNLMGKFSLQRGVNSWTALLYSFGIADLFLLFFNLIPAWVTGTDPLPQLFWLRREALGWGLLFLLGVGPTIGGFGFYTLSLAYLPASAANLIATLEPALTAAMAFVLLGEQFTLPQIAGSALIILSIAVLRLREGNGQAVQHDTSQI